MEYHWRNKTSGHVGTRTCVVSLSQQTCNSLDHYASPKKDARRPELSNSVYSSNVNPLVSEFCFSLLFEI